ncbi:MAG: type II secretion system F family protein [Rubripirellula sp.]|nr:type II secretion system F family protein [Rubripirellula sp.]
MPQHPPLPNRNSPNGYAEMFVWLKAIAKERYRQTCLALRGTDYRSLAQFSHDFAVCMRTISDVEKALGLCIRPICRTPFGQRWSNAVSTIRQGGTLTEALKPAKEVLPNFYLPLVSAGERSGRLTDVFSFLEEHCKSLAGPLATLRQTWFYPLTILVAGSFIRVLLYLFSGSVLGAMGAAVGEVVKWVLIVIMVSLVMQTPVRYFLDQLRLSIPILGALEKNIAIHRFFRVMSLVYEVGEHRVESMIRMSAETVDNHAVRLDLQRAANAIENQATIAEAFRKVRILSSEEQAAIEVGELAGTLEKTFEQISSDSGAAMLATLHYIQPVLFRITCALVICSILTTLLSLAH